MTAACHFSHSSTSVPTLGAMPHPRRRAPRTPLRRYAYVVLGVAAVLVAAALVSGSAVLVGVAAVLAVVLAITAVACLVEDSLAGRRVAAAANASLAATYTAAFRRQAADHQSELERLCGRVAALTGRVAELTARNVELADRNAHLEAAAALASAGSVTSVTSVPDERHDEDEHAAVVNLPVHPFARTPVMHARASGQ